MKKVTLKAWIKALRSGEYKQGRRELLFKGAFCCLGVYGKMCGVGEASLKINSYLYDLTGDISVPTKKFSESALASFNDGNDGYRQHSFTEIADILEGKIKPKRRDP